MRQRAAAAMLLAGVWRARRLQQPQCALLAHSACIDARARARMQQPAALGLAAGRGCAAGMQTPCSSAANPASEGAKNLGEAPKPFHGAAFGSSRGRKAPRSAPDAMRLLGLVLLGAAPSPALASVKGAVGSRAVAQAVLVRTARDAAYADRALESELRKARPPLTPADAKHATAVVYGVMRQRAYLDFALGQLAGPDVADRSDERTIAALRIGAFELLVSARPPHRTPHPSPHRQSHVARSHRTRATGAVHAHATTRRRQLGRRARETQGRARFRQRRAAQPLEAAGAQLPPDSRPHDCHLLAIPTLTRRRARSLSPRPPCLPSTPSPRAPTCPSGCSLRCDRCYPRTRT